MKLLGLKKEKWTLADPFAVGMMLNWSLAYNMKHELLYYKIAKKIGREKSKELLNFIPPDSPTIMDGKHASLREQALSALVQNLGSLAGSQSSSNNWVVAPRRSAYKGPILANDPHVHDSKIPSDFYLIHVKTKDFEAAGGQVIGLPFIAFGYNRYIAWGITNNGADHVDVFIESVNDAKKTYHFKGKEYPLSTKQETFYVKGKAPVQKTLSYVGRRPLLHEIFSELNESMSIDWVGFESLDVVEGFSDLNRARNHTEFLEAIRKIRMTPQNMVYADRAGNIAYQLIGALPARQKGTGNFPQSGDKVGGNWDGVLPAEKNPGLLNPDRGFIITSNNKTVSDFSIDMNGTYAPRYRYERIEEMIEGKNKVDLDYVKRMQADSQTLLFQKVLPIIKRYVNPGNDELSRKALEIVTRWDSVVSPDSVAASIYNTFMVRFMFQTFVDELGKDLAVEYVSERYISLERFFLLIEGNSQFFDDISTPQKETIRDIASRAFRETLKILAAYTGSEDVESWRWGKIHTIRFDHPLGKSKLLARLVNHGPLPFQGDCETNNRAHFYEIAPPFTTTLAAALRLIVVFDPEPKGHLVLITGQNEYFLSDHYADMIKLWMEGGYFSVEDAPVKYKMVFRPHR
jgi:penicillin amidase